MNTCVCCGCVMAATCVAVLQHPDDKELHEAVLDMKWRLSTCLVAWPSRLRLHMSLSIPRPTSCVCQAIKVALPNSRLPVWKTTIPSRSCLGILAAGGAHQNMPSFSLEVIASNRHIRRADDRIELQLSSVIVYFLPLDQLSRWTASMMRSVESLSLGKPLVKMFGLNWQKHGVETQTIPHATWCYPPS